MYKNYIHPATQILQSNNQAAFKELTNALMQPNQLMVIFEQSKESLELTFVACEILSKKIRDYEFITYEQIYDFEGNTLKEQKVVVLIQIVKIISGTLSKQHVEKRIKNSCINLISLCMKAMFEIKKTSESFQQFLSILVPTYHNNRDFTSSNDREPVIITPAVMETRQDHSLFVKILSSLLDYATTGAYSPNYYTFRRSLYVFKNAFLAPVLAFTINYLKIHFHHYFHQKQLLNLEGLKECLELLEKILMYPYSLNISEPDFMDSINDDIAGTNSEIYFPTYFRNFLCDEHFLRKIVTFCTSQIKYNSNFNGIRSQVYSCLRIIGRSLSSTSYVFVGEKEVQNFHNLSIEFMINLMMEERHFDSWYIYCILMVQMKMFSSYTIEDYQNKKEMYVESLLQFLKNVMKNARVKLQDGHKNPIRQIFEFLKKINTENMGYNFEELISSISQQILEIFYLKITDNNANQIVMREFGFNNNQQVECFKELFKPIPDIAVLNWKKNLGILCNLNIDSLNQSSQVFWLHFSSMVLTEQKNTSEEQIDLILRFLKLAYNSRVIASLHFIHVLLDKMLEDFGDDGPDTQLWREYEKKTGQSFEQFLSDVMNYSLAILSVANYNLIQNSLEVIKSIFQKLNKFERKPFRKFYQIIEGRLKTINDTMLVKNQYVKLRMGLYTVISLIWMSDDSIFFIYNIYNTVIQPVRENPTSFVHFLRYMIDLTGLLDPIHNYDTFKILSEIAFNDLEELLPRFLGTKENRDIGFNEQVFVKTFVRLILQFSEDKYFRLHERVQSSVSLRIDALFRPYLIQLLNYDYPPKIVEIWIRFLKLNPLAKLLPLHPQMKEKNSPSYKTLLSEYFQNLHKLQSLEDFLVLCPYIENSVELMCDWWEQIMIRGFKPEINLRTIVQARIWETKRQKETFSKMLYRISRYDDRYWRVDQCMNEREYIDWFSTHVL